MHVLLQPYFWNFVKKNVFQKSKLQASSMRSPFQTYCIALLEKKITNVEAHKAQENRGTEDNKKKKEIQTV